MGASFGRRYLGSDLVIQFHLVIVGVTGGGEIAGKAGQVTEEEQDVGENGDINFSISRSSQMEQMRKEMG